MQFADVMAFFHERHSVSPTLATQLESVCYTADYPAKSHLLKSGQVCPSIWFLQEGAVRWYQHQEDEEVTTWLLPAGQLILCSNSFYGRKPSAESIQALEDCRVSVLDYGDWLKLSDQFPELTKILRMVSDDYYERLKGHDVALRRDAAARYRYLQQEFPELIDTVHPTVLASFLNMDTRTFYKIRNGMISARGTILKKAI